MSNDTRVRKLSELFGASFHLLREHATLLVGLSLIIDLPMALGVGLVGQFGLGAGGTVPDIDGRGVLLLALVVCVGVLALLALWPAVVAALTAACLDLYRGVESDFAHAFAAARERYWHLAWTLGLLALYEIGVLLALALPVAGVIWLLRLGGGFAASGTLLLGLGLVVALPVLLVVGVFAAGLTQLVVVVAVGEALSADETIGRSWRMAWSTRWRVAGLAAALWLVTFVPESLAEVARGSLSWLGAACWGLVQALVMAFGSAAWVAFYLDYSEAETPLGPGAESPSDSSSVFDSAPASSPEPLL